jgi:site-specific recombinase XerD
MTYTNNHIRANKQHAYVLIDNETTLPALFPALYQVEVLAHKKLATQKHELAALRFFYDFWFQKHGVTFDYYFYQTKYNIAECVGQLNGFYEYLRSNGESANVISLNERSSSNTLAKPTLAAHIFAVNRFLRFLNTRYMNQIYQSGSGKEVEMMYSNNLKRLHETTKNYNRLQKSHREPTSRYKSITKEQHALLDEMLIPSLAEFSDLTTGQIYSAQTNYKNPFQTSFQQFRNYLIHRLMYNYGLRVGELLLLTIDSFGESQQNSQGDVNYLLMVQNLPDEMHDPRSLPTTLKNEQSTRIIDLHIDDYNYFVIFLKQYRYPLFKNENSASDHRILFTTERGNYAPLTYSAIRKIYRKIDSHFAYLHPNFRSGSTFNNLVQLTPHVGRHSWAYITLEYIYEQLLHDEIRLGKNYGISSRLVGLLDAAADKLRALGGWSVTSSMPYKYARRYVEQLANQANINRINNAKLPSTLNPLQANDPEGDFDAFI